MSSILRSSKFLRYFVSLARNIVIPNRQEVDGTLLQRNIHLSGYNARFASSSSVSPRSTLEKVIRRLDEDARIIGRIGVKEIEEALNEIRLSRNASSTQSLMVIRCCGNLIPEETPEHRTKLVEEIWNTLEKLGVALDISHYNALLKVYLENEHKFSPSDFLAKLQNEGIEPNRVTYQRLIAGYCQVGDIAGATKILEFMKEKQMPVSEGVFDALILGHCKADDMQSAEGMLAVMRQAGLEPTNETYTILLCGYASRGDQAAVDRLITECKLKDVLLSDKDMLEVFYAASLAGNDPIADEILKNIKNMIGYNQDAANVLMRLVTNEKDEAAFKVLNTMQPSVKNENALNMSGHFIIKQMIQNNRPVEKITSTIDRLKNEGHTPFGIWLAVETSFFHGNVELTLGLLKELKKMNEPIRNHYFWPALMTAGKAGNIDCMQEVLKAMVNDFNIAVSVETLQEYYFPHVLKAGSKIGMDEALNGILHVGVGRRAATAALVLHLLDIGQVKPAVNLALQQPVRWRQGGPLSRMLVEALHRSGDPESTVGLLHVMSTSGDPIEQQRDDEEAPLDDLPGRFIIGAASYGLTTRYIPAVLSEMCKRGLSISSRCAEVAQSRLTGDLLTSEVSNQLRKLSSGQLTSQPIERPVFTRNIERDSATMNTIRERIKSNNEGQDKLLSATRSLFVAYCKENDLENALKIKQEWVEDFKQDLTPAWWANLIELYCAKNDLAGAKQCLDHLKSLEGEVELDMSKIAMLVKLFAENNNLDDAISLLKEVKSRREPNFESRSLCWQSLMALAKSSKNPENVKQLLKTLEEQKYIDINNVTLGPVINAYLLNDDVVGALSEFENCVKSHRATPYKTEITKLLIEKEDAERLQTLVDLSTQVHGEINSLYDLVMAFVECGRVRQARKILETPGLRARSNRLQTACERYQKDGKSEHLESLIKATKDLSFIDRSEIYYSLLQTYCESGNVDKALALWTQMQDEDINASDEFLVKLGNFLKSNGREVPFEIPIVKSSPGRVQQENADNRDQPTSRKRGQDNYDSPLLPAILAKNPDQALEIKASIEKSGKPLRKRDVLKLLDLLLETNRLHDVTDLLTSVPARSLPGQGFLIFIMNKLTEAGELDLLRRVGDHISVDLKKKTSYNSRYLNSAVIAGKAKEELDKMEKQIDSAQSQDELDNLAIMFPRGGIYGVLEASPSYYEQIVRVVDKYYEKGISSPANCLCMFHLGMGETEKAKELFEHYKMANFSRIMFQNVVSKARVSGNTKILEELIALLKPAASINPEVYGYLYSTLIDIYERSGDYKTALAKLDEGIKIAPLESFHRGKLLRLKEIAESNNIPFKFTIPEKKSEESSSSSSSDVETKKSLAMKN